MNINKILIKGKEDMAIKKRLFPFFLFLIFNLFFKNYFSFYIIEIFFLILQNQNNKKNNYKSKIKI